MPLSLWLVPHDGNPFTKTFLELISDTVPRNFLSPQDIHSFSPHVTLTSDFELQNGKTPQEWLDALQLPEFKAEFNEVHLYLDTLQAEDPFFRKMNISVNDNDNLKKLATACRRQVTGDSEENAQKWAESEYQPHLSLLYADVPTKDVQGKIPLIEMKIGFALGDLFACCGGTLCMGGHMVVVDTSKPVADWKPIAKRETPWVMWRATRNLM